ncbi:hypothetical protein [Streptomyces sp. NBC_01497]|uniref:hypothetical protein n=1 Tax=Streptomyces sp. NBC_01497 TaxID=2903885 RepID=UPI002E347BA0|nr:hypothetical protein [Streptomyces sp. NBC_01497]
MSMPAPAALFASLEIAIGKVIGARHRRHRASELRQFFVKIDKALPIGLGVLPILDNYLSRKTPVIKRWLLACPRLRPHLTPVSSSLLNLVERWFGEPAQKEIR